VQTRKKIRKLFQSFFVTNKTTEILFVNWFSFISVVVVVCIPIPLEELAGVF